MKENVITETTLYVEQIEEKVVIHELSTLVKLNINCKKYLDESCKYYGCSLKGRINGSKNLLNDKYKNPIIINEKKLLIIFPLKSLRNKKSLWVVYNNIEKYYQISKSKVLVYFKNGKQHTFRVSYYMFHNQILKCSRLLVVYQARNTEIALK